jgi:predicted SprT family Zn-dependent metalloprotease
MTLHHTEASIRKYAVQKLWEHGLGQQGWQFGFDNAVRRAGQCSFTTKKITLSRKLLAARTREASELTVVHEIAHALCGKSAGHGPVWQKKFKELGGNGKRCYDSQSVVKPIPFRYIATCSSCGHEYKHHRLPQQASCGKCNPRVYDEQYRLRFIDTRTGKVARDAAPRRRKQRIGA